MIVASGRHEEALARFDIAVKRLEAMETYAVTWFVADCAAALVEHDSTLWTVINRLGASATTHRFTSVAARFTALRDMGDRLSRRHS